MGVGCDADMERAEGLLITEDAIYFSAHYQLDCESTVGGSWSRQCDMQVRLRSKASGG